MFKNVSKCLIVFSVLLMTPLTTFAGGSSVGVYETDVRDKYLTAGKTDQLLMSFTVQSWPNLASELTLKSLSLRCLPAHGFIKAKLMHDGTEIDSTNFFLSSAPAGSQGIRFGENSFVIPINEITEFEILVDVRENTGDFMTACAVDNMEFYNLQNNVVYTDPYQNNIFDGITRLIYIDDPNSENLVETTRFSQASLSPTNLGYNTTDNLLLNFNLFSSSVPDTYINDIFIYCSKGSIIKTAKLETYPNVYPVNLIQTDGMTYSRPENTSGKRFVFSNLNFHLGPNDNAEFKLYGDTYDYFGLAPDAVTACNVIDVSASNEPFSPFSDLKPDHPNFDAIINLYWDGYVTGYDDGTFKPDQSMTRAEIMHLLIKGMDISADPEVYKDCFPDVTNEWYANKVCYAKEKGWINGYPDGTYKPGNTINNAEALKILLQTRNIPLSEINGGQWYYPYVNAAYERGVTDQTPGTFPAGENATRAEISEYLYRINNLFKI